MFVTYSVSGVRQDDPELLRSSIPLFDSIDESSFLYFKKFKLQEGSKNRDA